MAYTKTTWKDRVVQKPNTYTTVTNPDGTITLVPAPGTVTEEGTPVNAANMNNLETQFDEAKSYIDWRNNFTYVCSIASNIYNYATDINGYLYSFDYASGSFKKTSLSSGTETTLAAKSGLTVTNANTFALIKDFNNLNYIYAIEGDIANGNIRCWRYSISGNSWSQIGGNLSLGTSSTSASLNACFDKFNDQIVLCVYVNDSSNVRLYKQNKTTWATVTSKTGINYVCPIQSSAIATATRYGGMACTSTGGALFSHKKGTSTECPLKLFTQPTVDDTHIYFADLSISWFNICSSCGDGSISMVRAQSSSGEWIWLFDLVKGEPLRLFALPSSATASADVFITADAIYLLHMRSASAKALYRMAIP